MQAIAQKTISNILIDQWNSTNQKIAELAKEFPEDRYEFTPAAGVRTFAAVLRHLAFWNQYVADSARGLTSNDSLNEVPALDYPGKSKILEVFERTAAEAASALSEAKASKELQNAELALSFIAHSSEHYGQLVVYARLKGIVPPSSR